MTRNMFINQPTRKTNNKNSHALLINQKLHVIQDENGMWNLPNLGKQITQQQPQLQPHFIESEMNTVLDATTGDMLECRQLAKGSDREI